MKKEVVTTPLSDKFEQSYKDFLKNHSLGLLYYSLEYMNLLQELFPEAKITYYLALSDGQVSGVLPVYELETSNGRIINSSPFFGSYGGILANDEHSKEALLAKYNEILLEPNIASSTVITNPFDDNSLEYPHSHKISRICQVTNIENFKSEDELLDGVDSTTRRNIRKAKKSDLDIAIDNKAAPILREIHLANMTEIGGATKPPLFFEALEKHFVPGEQYEIYVAKKEDQIVACLLLFYWNSTVEYFTPATFADFRQFQPSALLISEAMISAARKGYKYWNWGGTWDTQEGVYRFKKKWGASDLKYDYFIELKNHDLTQLSKTEIQEFAPYFYSLPYDLLQS